MAHKAQGHIFLAGPMFHDLIQRRGTLPESLLPGGEMEFHSHCAWYFVQCAHKAILTIPGQVSLEGETDLTVNLRPILDNVLLLYGLLDSDDINKVMNLMPLCRRIAFMRNLPWSDRFQAWLDSGGRAYDEVTREPDAI